MERFLTHLKSGEESLVVSRVRLLALLLVLLCIPDTLDTRDTCITHIRSWSEWKIFDTLSGELSRLCSGISAFTISETLKIISLISDDQVGINGVERCVTCDHLLEWRCCDWPEIWPSFYFFQLSSHEDVRFRKIIFLHNHWVTDSLSDIHFYFYCTLKAYSQYRFSIL